MIRLPTARRRTCQSLSALRVGIPGFMTPGDHRPRPRNRRGDRCDLANAPEAKPLRRGVSVSIMIVGQAPGRVAEETDIVWNDRSGDRLRD